MPPTDAHPLRFGVLVLPNEPWPDLESRWHRLEEGGVDSIWSCDHFTNPRRPGQPWFEAGTSLAALAAATVSVRIGLLVGAIVSRSPTLFSKQAQTVDHMSGGRLDVGIGAGGGPTDQHMWGVEGWSQRERAGRFAEYVEVVDLLMRGGEVSWKGRWYQTDGATMTPGFLQQPRPPLVLAGHVPSTLAVVARFGDTWNTYGPSLAEARANQQLLDRACHEIGRDPTGIRRSVLLGLTDGTAWTTPAEFENVVHAWFDEGFREFIFYDPPYARPGTPSAAPDATNEILAASLPRLREQLA